eukprot:6206545-Pleurochrysis_carterae.AAC.1
MAQKCKPGIEGKKFAAPMELAICTDGRLRVHAGGMEATDDTIICCRRVACMIRTTYSSRFTNIEREEKRASRRSGEESPPRHCRQWPRLEQSIIAC